MTKRICLWSGPRNISTALMYSFAQRSDTQVVDEPLYAHYLRVSGQNHPARQEILAVQENDGERVVERFLGAWPKPVVFFKQMAHHLVELNWDFMSKVENVLLIRHPALVITSFSKVIPNPVLGDIGIKKQYELVRHLRDIGQNPIILDGPSLLKNPEGVLKNLCISLGIPFMTEMLSWKAGKRPEDGVWAPYWYKNVHLSTGFQPFVKKEKAVPRGMESLLEESLPYYEALFEGAVKG